MVLVANEGNVKRTARETGIPEATVRRFWKMWKENPPTFEEGEMDTALGDFVENAHRVRFLAIEQLEKKVRSGDASVRDLTVLVGVLDDKLTRAQGIATSRVEHVHALPSGEEIREALGHVVAGMIEAASSREGEIEILDAEYREIKPDALPAGD